jgi:hypothetical protein
MSREGVAPLVLKHRLDIRDEFVGAVGAQQGCRLKISYVPDIRVSPPNLDCDKREPHNPDRKPRNYDCQLDEWHAASGCSTGPYGGGAETRTPDSADMSRML